MHQANVTIYSMEKGHSTEKWHKHPNIYMSTHATARKHKVH